MRVPSSFEKQFSSVMASSPFREDDTILIVESERGLESWFPVSAIYGSGSARILDRNGYTVERRDGMDILQVDILSLPEAMREDPRSALKPKATKARIGGRLFSVVSVIGQSMWTISLILRPVDEKTESEDTTEDDATHGAQASHSAEAKR